MNYRILELFYNVDLKTLYDAEGFVLNANHIPYITFTEQVLVQLQLVVNANLDVYTKLPIDSAYSCVIDDDFIHNDEPYLKTINDSFNIDGDWKNNGNADVTLGQLSFRLDANTEQFQNNIGTKSQKTNTSLEIKSINDEAKLNFIIFFDFYCKNVMDLDSSIPIPTPEGDYYTRTQSDARYAKHSIETDVLTLSADLELALTGFNITDTKTDDYTAEIGDSIRTNTELSGSFDILLPATPDNGDEIAVVDVNGSWSTENLILLGNGKNINNVSGDFVCNVDKSYLELQFITETDNWIVKEIPDSAESHSHSNLALLNEIDQDLSVSGDVNFNSISTTEMGDVKDYIDNSSGSGVSDIIRITKYLSLGLNYIQLENLIDSNKPVEMILPNSPTLINGYGFYISGSKLYLDSELPFEDNYQAIIIYEKFSEEGFDDYVGFTSIHPTEILDNIFLSCISGEVNTLKASWGDTEITGVNITDVESELTHEYTSLYNNNIKSVILGTEDSSNIESLILHDNSILFANVSNFPDLIIFHCYNNLLTSIDITENLSLERIQFTNNQLTSINLIYNAALIEVNLNLNQIDYITLDNNPNIENLNLSSNLLTTLDLEANHLIKTLNVNNNELVLLEIVGLTLIESIELNNNNIDAGATDGSDDGTLNNILKILDDNGVENGYCDMSDQSPDNAPDTTLLSNLTAKGWTILT